MLLFFRFAQSAAAVLFAGTAALRLLAGGTGITAPRSWRLLAAACWAAMVGAAVGQLWLTTAQMSGEPASLAAVGHVLRSTRFGGVWQARLILLTVMPLALARPGMGALLGEAFLATLVFSGHADASPARAWLLPTDVLHVLAAGVWPGGLLPLALLLGRAREQPADSMLRMVRRFSTYSVVAVAIIAVTALLNGSGLIGKVPALWESAYGRLALAKATLFLALITLGAMNRRELQTASLADRGELHRCLWRNVLAECGLAALVLLVAETLAVTPPSG